MEAAKAAIKHGYKVTEAKLARLLGIEGVGEGTQYCNYEMTIPFAIPLANAHGVPLGESRIMDYIVPACEGS